MKKLLTLALAATLGVASFANAANENVNELSDVKAKDKKIQVNLKEGLGKVRLAILDKNGNKLHQQTVNVKQDLKVPYDLSNLPAGEYFVVVENNRKQPDADKAVFTVETKDEPIQYPLMAYAKALDAGTFRLAVVGLDEPGVKVEIFDSKGTRVFKEQISEPEGFSKIYHLDHLSTNEITLKVTDAKGRVKNLYF